MQFIKYFFNIKTIQRPLGRWGLHNKDYLKTDYANVDNCGDILCHNPVYLQKLKKYENIKYFQSDRHSNKKSVLNN